MLLKGNNVVSKEGNVRMCLFHKQCDNDNMMSLSLSMCLLLVSVGLIAAPIQTHMKDTHREYNQSDRESLLLSSSSSSYLRLMVAVVWRGSITERER